MIDIIVDSTFQFQLWSDLPLKIKIAIKICLVKVLTSTGFFDSIIIKPACPAITFHFSSDHRLHLDNMAKSSLSTVHQVCT